jgi:surface antigen
LLYHGTLFFAREQGKTIGAGAKHGEMRGTQARTPGRWSKTRGKNVGLRA